MARAAMGELGTRLEVHEDLRGDLAYLCNRQARVHVEVLEELKQVLLLLALATVHRRRRGVRFGLCAPNASAKSPFHLSLWLCVTLKLPNPPQAHALRHGLAPVARPAVPVHAHAKLGPRTVRARAAWRGAVVGAPRMGEGVC